MCLWNKDTSLPTQTVLQTIRQEFMKCLFLRNKYSYWMIIITITIFTSWEKKIHQNSIKISRQTTIENIRQLPQFERLPKFLFLCWLNPRVCKLEWKKKSLTPIHTHPNPTQSHKAIIIDKCKHTNIINREYTDPSSKVSDMKILNDTYILGI